MQRLFRRETAHAVRTPSLRQVRVAARDVAGVVGGVLIAYGAWMIAAPAGFIVGGVELVAVAYLAARAGV